MGRKPIEAGSAGGESPCAAVEGVRQSQTFRAEKERLQGGFTESRAETWKLGWHCRFSLPPYEGHSLRFLIH